MARNQEPLIKPAGWVVIILILGVAGYFSVKHFAPGINLLGSRAEQASAIPPSAELPPPGVAPSTGTVPRADVPLPKITLDTAPGCSSLPEVRTLVWEWNAQMGLHNANGGPQATRDSLMCRNGVNSKLIRQDDSGKMQEELATFAEALHAGEAQPKAGAHFVIIMGDGGANFLAPLNAKLKKKFGPEYVAQMVSAVGSSLGEDKFMGLPKWKENPHAAQGAVIAGYLRDGDWNIALKWAHDNGICNNPDERTYNPHCLNWVAASDYLDAGAKYVAGYCEDRPVVDDAGRPTGAKQNVCVNGVVTWTPGDVNVAEGRGGLVSIVSTEVYSTQMPSTVIGIKKWMQANRPTVVGYIRASLEGGRAVKSGDIKEMARAATVAAAVYSDKTPDYWVKYFTPVEVADKVGLTVRLGGSSVYDMADALDTFGVSDGAANKLAATYKVFGEMVHSQYPDLLPSFPPVSEVIDDSYLRAAHEKMVASGEDVGATVRPTYGSGAQTFGQVGKKSWHIEFESGKATFTRSALAEMDTLFNQLLTERGTNIDITGFTDSVGDDSKNKLLSERRAQAVAQELTRRSSADFPRDRFFVNGLGSANPVGDNGTSEGRAQNRRVEIVLKALSKS